MSHAFLLLVGSVPLYVMEDGQGHFSSQFYNEAIINS